MLALMWKNFFAFKGVINFALESIGLDALTIAWLSTISTAKWAVLVPDIWASVGFYVLIFADGLVSVPNILYDAAAIDGANAWQQLRHVTLPAMRGVYVVAVILALPGALSTFIYPYGMTQGGPARQTFTLGLWVFTNVYASLSSRPPNIGYGSAIALLHAAIAIIFGIIVWRYGRKDVAIG
jgi:ABC-type sugar transport system permease subunit